MFSKIALAKMIDQSLLKPDATQDDVVSCCDEAMEFHFACVMVLPCWCHFAERRLRHSDVKLGTVIAYPFGAIPTSVKVYEARQAISNGAMELDIVVNLSALKSHDYTTVQRDIEELVTVANIAGLTEDGDDILTKVIIEVGMTTREEQTRVCRIANAARADFIKTCTGNGPRGVTVHDVKHIRQAVGGEMGVKAAGGIRTLEQAVALINAGANRIGTSTGVHIVQSYDQSQGVLTEEVLH
ncbi:MAG: deoxyribose-phosphate aldolase [Armatimonadota bacterium]|nr:MAG: deoxyribose-phosphate aldolase [Armatimonadota bacterium]